MRECVKRCIESVTRGSVEVSLAQEVSCQYQYQCDCQGGYLQSLRITTHQPVNAENRNNPKGSRNVPNTVRPFGSFPLLSLALLNEVRAPAPNIFPTSSNNSFCRGLKMERGEIERGY